MRGLRRVAFGVSIAAAAIVPLPGQAATDQPTAAPDVSLALPASRGASTPDPVALSWARRIAQHVIPDDALARLAPQFFYMFGSTETYARMIVDDELRAIGMAPSPRAKPDDYVIAARILDPSFEQRVAIMGGISAQRAEDSVSSHLLNLRTAYAQALALRFSLRQLKEIERFFSSATGAAFAASSYDLPSVSPLSDYLQQMFAATVMKLPALQQRIESETQKLPPKRTLADLPSPQRRSLLTLIAASPAPPPR